jgi:hypothetical protein
MIKQTTIPCTWCGTPTRMLGTKLCDGCWELEGRVRRDPELATKMLAGITGKTVVLLTPEQLETTKFALRAVMDEHNHTQQDEEVLALLDAEYAAECETARQALFVKVREGNASVRYAARKLGWTPEQVQMAVWGELRQ